MSLQWGRAHRSAETRSAWECRIPSKTLQWGRAHGSAETYAEFVKAWISGDNFNGAALTEARKQVNRNTRSPQIQQQLQWGRAYRSAETMLCALIALTCRILQWGRAHRSAETQQIFTIPGGGVASLQWGRAYRSAETHRPFSLLSLTRYFNGAALTEARKLSRLALKFWGNTSMGPRSQKRGNGATRI